MALIELHFHVKDAGDNEQILKLLQTTHQKLNTIMATLQEVSAKVDELQTALDVEQEQIQAALATLQSAVDDLTAQLADGGTPEERQAVLDKVTSAIADLESTVSPEA